METYLSDFRAQQSSPGKASLLYQLKRERGDVVCPKQLQQRALCEPHSIQLGVNAPLELCSYIAVPQAPQVLVSPRRQPCPPGPVFCVGSPYEDSSVSTEHSRLVHTAVFY